MKPKVSEIPEMLALWDHERNKPHDPTEVTSGSDRLMWWKCPNHEFSFQASPQSMSRGRRCNVCSGKVVVAGFNDLLSSGRKFLSEWDYNRNEVDPSQVSRRSNKPFWWECFQGHYWKESPDFRIRRGDECPYCINKRTWPGFNDLTTTHPDLALEWHPTLNSIHASEVTAGADYKASWACQYGHSWETWVYARTGVNQNGCPTCWSLSTSSKVEAELSEILGATQNPTLPIRWDSGRSYSVDMILTDGVTVVEYDGAWWHRNTLERDELKTDAMIQHGFRVIRVRENELPMLTPRAGLHQVRYYPKQEGLESIAQVILDLSSL